jgi:hypothetical protein
MLYRIFTSALVAFSLSQPVFAHFDVDIDQLADGKLDWIANAGDLNRVKQYARVGNPHVTHDSPGCTPEFPDTLGSGEFLFCVAVTDLTKEVTQDIATMQVSRFDNVSDYDQRITRFLVARHDGSLHRYLKPNDVRMLAAMLDISSEFVGRIYFSKPTPGSRAWLSSLRGLYVGDNFIDQTSLFQHTAGLPTSQEFIQVGFGPEEVSLYPGGGYTTRFTFFINEEFIIYAKTEGWNS